MKNLFILLAVLFSSLSLCAQTEVRDLKTFNQLRVSGNLDVTLQQGSPKAEITMVKGDIEELEINQRGNDLHIKFREKINWTNKRKANIVLYTSELSSIDVSAGADVAAGHTYTASKFSVDASSGASISVAVDAQSLDADVSSGAKIEIEGSANKLNVDVSSGGSYDGRMLEAREVDADVSSGGSIKVWATESLEADASSGGSIKYKGDPKEMDIDSGKWSGGSIRKI